MGNPKGFMEVQRKEAGNRPVEERIDDYGEVEQTLNTEDRKFQASRCMDCGIPFCNWGCPVASNIPDWQDAIYRGNWKEASAILHETNEFPEFTGRICPAPCEKACVLAIHNEAVTIRENEAAVIERAFEMGFIHARPPVERTGKTVAVVGSGPAGLSIAARLNRMGHLVDVYEKDNKAGGLLRYGIPDFKLNKKFIDRRLAIFAEEGLRFHTGVNVGTDISAEELLAKYDAIVLAIGASVPRDLDLPGRDLLGIHFAMDYMVQQNRVVDGQHVKNSERISAHNKHVVVLGGGDTGSDCVGTAIRQKAASVTQVELLPKPPLARSNFNPWPYWPDTLRTSSSHEEGCTRLWAMETIRFSGIGKKVNGLYMVDVDWHKNETGQWAKTGTRGRDIRLDADLVILALGFLSPEKNGLLQALGVSFTNRGNVSLDKSMQTSVDGVFAVGDATLGASLVVRAIAQANEATGRIHRYLMELK